MSQGVLLVLTHDDLDVLRSGARLQIANSNPPLILFAVERQEDVAAAAIAAGARIEPVRGEVIH